MARIARVSVVVASVTLLVLWSIVAKHTLDQVPVSTVGTPFPAHRGHDGRGPSGSRELALFGEIFMARQSALREAETLAPLQEGGRTPSAPSVVLQKGGAKRDRLVGARFAKMLVDIAHAHGMTRREIEDIYRRGVTEGWPTSP